jgi:hypothetical protein
VLSLRRLGVPAQSSSHGLPSIATAFLLALSTIALLWTLPTAADAGQKPTQCYGSKYAPFPRGTVRHLVAYRLPKLTDGYAPRCLVAEQIAEIVQGAFADGARIPRHVRTQGARWEGPRWAIHYRRRGRGLDVVAAYVSQRIRFYVH